MTSTRVTTPLEGRPAPAWDEGAPIPAPLRLLRCRVPEEWQDYNGHMSESCYLLAFGNSADALFRYLGVDEAYRDAGASLFTVETHLHHRREAAAGDRLAISVRLLDSDDRRIHLFQEMSRGEVLLASAEQLLVHVDTVRGRSAGMPAWLRQRVAAVTAAHRALPVPEVVGRPMGIRRG